MGKGDLRGDADADGRMRFLDRFGPNIKIVALVVLARERKTLRGPGLQDDLQVLVEALAALGIGRVEAVVRVRESAAPDPALHPPLTDMVQGGDIFGEADRMA